MTLSRPQHSPLKRKILAAILFTTMIVEGYFAWKYVSLARQINPQFETEAQHNQLLGLQVTCIGLGVVFFIALGVAQGKFGYKSTKNADTDM